MSTIRRALAVLLLVVLSRGLSAQGAGARPTDLPLIGLAGITFRVSDLDKARRYYQGVLGFPEAFTLKDPTGRVNSIFFKVNDDQYVEIVPGLAPGTIARQVRAEAPRSKVLALSMHTESGFVLGILEAGASGYLLKDSAFEELAVAVKAILKDQIYLSPAIAGVVLSHSLSRLGSKRKSEQVELSKREREVLQLIAEGKSTKEIAATLYVSVKTVETHRKQIMDKLDVYSVAGLTKYAVREGLTSLQK